MMKNAKPVTPEMIASFRKRYEEDEVALTLTAAASGTDLATIAKDPVKAAKLQNTFSVEVKTNGITNQKASGRSEKCSQQSCL